MLSSPFSNSWASPVGCSGSALATALGLRSVPHPPPRSTADACTNAGVTSSIARKAYGETATIAPLTEPGNLPKALADVPVCFIFAHHGLVATVRLYSPGSLVGVDRHLQRIDPTESMFR